MNKLKGILCVLAVGLCFMLGGLRANAAGPTDEISRYEITVDVNEDATLNINYHIEWKVLESEEAGPLSWVEIGIPNQHYVDYQPLSDNIDSMDVDTSDGCYAEIYFDREYVEGETVSFDFMLVQDYMYQVDGPEEGKTLYAFTPGWFDEIEVKDMVIRWNSEKVDNWSPEAYMEDGYLEWSTSLGAGEKFSVRVIYPNDAYAFDVSKDYEEVEDEDTSGSDGVLMVIIFGGIFYAIVASIVKSIRDYNNSSNLGAAYTTKITRTKIVYWPVCQGCGSAREEGKDTCSYCGRSMIKSEEVIKEEKVPAEDKEAMKYKKNGTYQYSSDPNIYVRVHAVRVPSPRPARSSASSCAHSSCACACACAGGGRAGCSTKDFYRTSLRISQLKHLTGGRFDRAGRRG